MSTGPMSLLERLAPVPADGIRAARGRAWFETAGLPDPRAEAWRSTPLDEIVAALGAAGPAPATWEGLDPAVVDDLAGDHGGPRLVFVNGALDPALSDLGRTPAGAWLGGADGLRPRRTPGAPAPIDEPVDGFHALSWAAGRDVAAVLVDPGVELPAPIHVVHLAAPGRDPSVTHPRTVVRVGAAGHLDLIETFVGLDGPSITNASTRVLAGEGAAITYHRVVAEAPDAIHVGRTAIEQSARSAVQATTLLVGGHIIRNAVDVRLAGADSRVALAGLYRPVGRQRHDNVITVDHVASGGTSTQRFKGIVDDAARGSFSGHVIVRPGTVGTDASQSNPNLVLAPTAQADTRPWLEILADDVRCTHGATVGRLDQAALFYLRSRGIPEAEGRAMLIEAFAAEILDAISPPSLRDLVVASLARQISGVAR
jgi:Fe-S cluster assembly protein SufD